MHELLPFAAETIGLFRGVLQAAEIVAEQWDVLADTRLGERPDGTQNTPALVVETKAGMRSPGYPGPMTGVDVGLGVGRGLCWGGLWCLGCGLGCGFCPLSMITLLLEFVGPVEDAGHT
jgi:hypothetical protein